MADRPRSRRSSTRYLAPLALAAAVAGVYLIAHNTLDGGGHHSATSTTSGRGRGRSASTTAGDRRARTGRSGRAVGTRSGSGAAARTGSGAGAGAFYTVRSGDDMSSIAARTGVPLRTLEQLNPHVSSTSLQVGQRLRLRR